MACPTTYMACPTTHKACPTTQKAFPNRTPTWHGMPHHLRGMPHHLHGMPLHDTYMACPTHHLQDVSSGSLTGSSARWQPRGVRGQQPLGLEGGWTAPNVAHRQAGGRWLRLDRT